jgi:hypothetical protein
MFLQIMGDQSTKKLNDKEIVFLNYLIWCKNILLQKICM